MFALCTEVCRAQFVLRSGETAEAYEGSRGVLQKNLAVRSGPWLGLTKHRSDDFWSALRTVAEADMANLQNLMIRLTDCDLRNIRQCATATLMTSQAEEVAEQTSGSQTRTTLLRPQQEGLKFADGTTTTTKVAVDAISMPPAATRPTVGPPDIPVKQVPKNKATRPSSLPPWPPPGTGPMATRP